MSTAYLKALLAKLEAPSSDEDEEWPEDLDELKETKVIDGAIYPVLTLPAEIVSEIFVHCLPFPPPGVPREIWNLNPHPRTAPLLLLQICSAWRSIAISTPRLFDQLHLNFEHLPLLFSMSLADIMEFVDLWFSRAGSRPLSLGVWGSESEREELASSVVCAVLPRYALKLQSLSLDLKNDDFKRIVAIGPFPLLEQLTIGLPFDNDLDDLADLSDPDMNIQGIIVNAPRLAQLTLSDDASPSTCWKFPWKQLAIFTCEYLDGKELLDVLREANSLVECTCSVLAGMRSIPTEVVVHVRLKTLRLVDGSGADFLQFLRLPALQNLHLSFPNHRIDDDSSDDSSDVDTIYQYPLHPSVSSSGTAVASVEWLSHVSSLTTLELSDPKTLFMHDFIPKLDRSSAKGKLFLPHLQKLVFLDCCRVVTTPLVQALSSRSVAHAGMARLELFRQIWRPRMSAGIDAPVVRLLRGLVKSGMKVHVGSVSRNEV